MRHVKNCQKKEAEKIQEKITRQIPKVIDHYQIKPGPKYPRKSSRQLEFNKKLVKLYAKRLLPTSMVEWTELKDLIHFADPKFSFPSRKTFVKKHIDQEYQKQEEELQSLLQKPKTINITTDMWSSK